MKIRVRAQDESYDVYEAQVLVWDIDVHGFLMIIEVEDTINGKLKKTLAKYTPHSWKMVRCD